MCSFLRSYIRFNALQQVATGQFVAFATVCTQYELFLMVNSDTIWLTQITSTFFSQKAHSSIIEVASSSVKVLLWLVEGTYEMVLSCPLKINLSVFCVVDIRQPLNLFYLFAC